LSGVVGVAAEKEVILGILVFAGFVFASWLLGVKFPELKNQAGKFLRFAQSKSKCKNQNDKSKSKSF